MSTILIYTGRLNLAKPLKQKERLSLRHIN